MSSIGDELQILNIQAIGEYVFFADSLDENLENIGLIAAYNGNVSGGFLINERKYSGIDKTVYVEISSNHNWELIFKPIASARNFEESVIDGRGSEVIEAYTFRNSNNIISVTFIGDYNFFLDAYDCNGQNNGLIIAEYGTFSGNYRIEKDTCFLAVETKGEWAITK